MNERLKQYIRDNEFRITVFEDRVHIINYDEILSLEEERISVVNRKQRIIIKGRGLLLSKLLDNEALIRGKVFHIEVSYDK